MKKQLLNLLTGATMLLFSTMNYAQAPTLGTAADFVLFTSNGAVSNTGISHITGNVGTNNGSSTAFGNVNGVMHHADGASAKCAADLLIAYNQLNATTATLFPASLLGNGQILNAGIYSISEATTLNLDLTLNAQGNANAIFIFKIQGSLSTNAGAKVKLINGAQACNVYWKVEGKVSMATQTFMRGTIIANNAEIVMNTKDTLEGRALSTTGAITIDGVLAYTPIGCGSPVLTGPKAPALGAAACYAIFSSSGAVSNTGVTFITGDVGTNVGSTIGFDALNVTGAIHPIPDGSTAQSAADLLKAYNYVNTLPYDIELLYPAQFGNNLVLTPHTYIMKGAATFTDSLYLNAQGNADAVFIIQINGALSTSTYSKVLLINGAQAKNVYWKIEGAVSINNYSVFCGTIICNNGALGALNTGVTLNGRALTTTGALTTAAINAIMPIGCGTSDAPKITAEPADQIKCVGSSASFAVVATGTDPEYQWRKGATIISGATSSTFTINPVNISDAASNYNVIVSGAFAPNDTSSNVTLTVNTAPNITSEIANQKVCSGGSASFSIIATGTALTYQFRKGTVNLVNAGNISGANSTTLTINPISISDTSSTYNVVISGTCGTTSTSNDASLSLKTVQECNTSLDEDKLNDVLSIYPNPFTSSIAIMINDASQSINYELRICNVLGEVLCISKLNKSLTNIETNHLPSGIYFYMVIENGKTIQSGKIVSQ